MQNCIDSLAKVEPLLCLRYDASVLGLRLLSETQQKYLKQLSPVVIASDRRAYL